jgi:hypothetical protein
MVALEPENVAGGGRDIPAGGQGDAAQKIETDPQPPGVVVVEIGYRSDPLGEAQNSQYKAYENDNAGYHIEWGKYLGIITGRIV